MKRPLPNPVSYFVLATSLFFLAPLWGQQTGARVTPDMLQTRIEAAQDSATLDEAQKARLIDLYRQSLSNLESIRASKEATEEFRQATRTAPAELEKIRARMDRWAAQGPVADLQISAAATSDSLSAKLDEELANLTAISAKLAVLEARVESEAQRPALVRQQITAARSAVEELASRSGDPAPRDQNPQILEAASWASTTRLESLQEQITLLDRELLTYGPRNDLLSAQRDEQATSSSRTSQKVELLRAAVNERRRDEAEKAMGEAEAALEGATANDPLVGELAQANLDLVGTLADQVAQLDELVAIEGDRPRTTQIDSAFRSARRKLELDGQGAGAAVGLAILEQRRQFPTARSYLVQRRAIGRSLSVVSLRLLESAEERALLREAETYLMERIVAVGQQELTSSQREEAMDLLQTRRTLLERSIANDNALQRRLYALDDVLQRLIQRTTAYDAFLAERMLWVRTTKGADKATWAQLPGELIRYLAPASWLGTLQFAAARLLEAPLYLLIVLVALLIAIRRKTLNLALLDTGGVVARIREDNMAVTFKAVALTIVLAAPVPLTLGAVGAGLVSAPEAPGFANAVGTALVNIAIWVAFPLILLVLFKPGGVADQHFRWDGAVLKSLRQSIRLFVLVAFPVDFVLVTSNLTDQQTGIFGGALTLIAFTALMVTLAVLILRIGHPTKGVIAPYLADHPDSRWWRWRQLWLPLIVLIPVALAVLALSGFNYTSQQLVHRLFQSIWLITAIWLIGAVVRRWLVMTSRRLAYEKALKSLEESRARRLKEAEEPASAGSEHEEGGIGEPEIDLVAMDADSQKLLNAVILLIGALGLIAVWGDVLPALSLFEKIEFWNRSIVVDGIQTLAPVTAGDVLMALVVSIGGYILVANLPSLINIILLKQGSVSAGGRYAVQTLTSYVIIAVAVLYVLNTLGLNASQLGFAAAALGVGIGFGLQEIVANFICGLILLFERPVRVGDVVTIGTESGVVSKIRIRATTLRDWEKKELIIPNKELITGRLLNWTLSDSVTRLFITIGIAYGSDVERAMGLIMEAARENDAVLDDPEPSVHFEQFGDSSLNISLRAYVATLSERLVTITALHKAIDNKFREAGIVIPFPQRDVHLFKTDGGTPADGGGDLG